MLNTAREHHADKNTPKTHAILTLDHAWP